MYQVQEHETVVVPDELGKVISVPRISIRPFPGQPRKYFDQQKLRELAASIKAIGQIVPGLVKEISGNYSPQKYELVDGQRRWHALDIAGIEKMKVIVITTKDEAEQFLVSVVSNFGRAEHAPLEIANAIQRFRDNNISVAQIAEIFAKCDAWIYQHLKILRLDPEVQKMMSPEIPEDNRLLFSTALMLADIPLDLQKSIADVIIGEGLKLKQARNLIRRRAEKLGIRVGDPGRAPSEDYRNFRSFVNRMMRELEIFTEMPQSFFNKMFEFREEEDHVKIIERLEENIGSLEILLEATRRAKKGISPYAEPVR